MILQRVFVGGLFLALAAQYAADSWLPPQPVIVSARGGAIIVSVDPGYVGFYGAWAKATWLSEGAYRPYQTRTLRNPEQELIIDDSLGAKIRVHVKTGEFIRRKGAGICAGKNWQNF